MNEDFRRLQFFWFLYRGYEREELTEMLQMSSVLPTNCPKEELSIKFKLLCPYATKRWNSTVDTALDLFIADCFVVELKAVDTLLKIHQAQILTCMKLANAPLGLLTKFNATPLKSGIQRYRI